MHPSDEGSATPSEAALADRLARLAERRHVTERRHRTPTASSDDEGETGMPPRCSAVQALRELLEGRGAALEGGVKPSIVVGWGTLPPAPTGLGSSEDLAQEEWAAPLQQGSSPLLQLAEQGPQPAPARGVDGGSGAGSAGSSVPPTARLLINLDNGHGREAVAAVRRQRTAELRDADAAVREAEAQRAELDAMLLRQRAAEAQRERQRAERQAELARIQLTLARQHMAAWIIERAWRRFLASPGRLREVAAATRIQAVWRGWTGQRLTAVEMQRYKERRALLSALHAAVAGAELDQARQVAHQLAALGAEAHAMRQVATLEQQASKAEQALRTAAVQGSVQPYHAAVAAAQRYRHLSGALREAAHLFEARVAAAEDAVTRVVEGGPLLQFQEAVAAAVALGVGGAFLARAEQRINARNQEAAATLRTALEAAPFCSQTFAASLERAQQCGLHADAARAQRTLQLRRHREVAALQQLAAQGGAAEVEAACREVVQLGMEAEVEAAMCRLEQRQANAVEELREAAYRGTLQQYEAAAEAAADLQVSTAVQQTCKEQLKQRQMEAEQQLRVAAAGQGSAELSVVRKRCQVAASLGLAAAVNAAEQQVCSRREQAVEQLVRSTRAACEFASGAAQAGRERGDAAVVAVCATPRGTPWQLLLSGWLACTRELAQAVEERGAAAALLHPPPGCTAWPAQLCGWLVDMHSAAGLELEAPVAAAAATFQAHLEALQATSRMAVVQLLPVHAASSSSSSSSSRGSSPALCSSGGGACMCVRASSTGSLGSARSRPATAIGPPTNVSDQSCGGPQQQPTPRSQPTTARRQLPRDGLLGRFADWQAAQQHLVPLVAGAAEREAAITAEEEGVESAEVVPAGSRDLDLSCQGLESLDLLASGCPAAALNLNNNALTSLETLSALSSLRELRVSSNRLVGLEGLAALSGVTLLDASCNSLESLPSLTGLCALRHLDLSSNRLTAAALAGAGLFSASCAHLTSLCLADNPRLGELPGWLDPLPSLLRLDISGCGLASLEGLAAATPLLQVLAASRNRLTCLPPSLSLPFLRELWVGANQLAGVPSWPWLPSLRELHLQDNQLSSLAPLQGFASLKSLDLSFNQLPSLSETLASLAPASATLQQLHLNDNPFATPWGEHGHEHEQQAGKGVAYAAAVFRVLPNLQELDSQAISSKQQQRHLQYAARRRLPLPAGLNASCNVRQGPLADADWDERTVLWALTQPMAAAAVRQAAEQQQAMAMELMGRQADHTLPSSRLVADSLSTVLLGVQLAAAAGSEHEHMLAGAPFKPGSGPAQRAAAGRLRELCLAQQQYLLLAGAQPAAAQGLLVLNPAHYQQLLAQLTAAASLIQSAWRGCCARRMARRRAALLQAERARRAASRIQAAWRGWWCRQRHCAWVQHRLVIWRYKWGEAQRQVHEHRRRWAAVRVQATWRGMRVRRLLARARQSLWLEQQQRRRCMQWQNAAALEGQGIEVAAQGVEPDAFSSSLDAELDMEVDVERLLGGDGSLSALLAAPEVLRPELAAAPAVAGPMAAAPAALHGSTKGLAPDLAGPLPGIDYNPAAAGGGHWASQLAPAAAAAAVVQPPLLARAPLHAAQHSRGSPSPPSQLLSPSAAGSSPISVPTSPANATTATSSGLGIPSGWEFSDPATAAAFEQLRQRQRAAARRRELQAQMKDPVVRLQHFQGRSSVPPALRGSGSPGGSATAPSWPASGWSSRGGSGSGSNGMRRESTGESNGVLTLPALPSSRLVQALPADCSRPGSPCSNSSLCSRGQAATCGPLPPALNPCSPRTQHGGMEVRGKTRRFLPTMHVLQPFE